MENDERKLQADSMFTAFLSTFEEKDRRGLTATNMGLNDPERPVL